jgi:hypothetical protein
MSSEPRGKGDFTQKLLARAEGRVQGVQPKIPGYVAGDSGDKAPPIIELTNEVPASPRPDRNRAAPPHVSGRQASGPQLPAAELDDSFRLFPRNRPTERNSRMEAHSARTTDDSAVPEAMAERWAVADARAKRIGSNQGQAQIRSSFDDAMEVGDKRLVPPRSTGFPLAFDHGAELMTAIAQLLGDWPDESADGSHRADAPARSDRERSVDRSNSPISDLTARPEQPGDQHRATLTIHIGEIVIAPDPARPQGEMQLRDRWQPPLSLDDYRARRAREWK